MKFADSSANTSQTAFTCLTCSNNNFNLALIKKLNILTTFFVLFAQTLFRYLCFLFY